MDQLLASALGIPCLLDCPAFIYENVASYLIVAGLVILALAFILGALHSRFIADQKRPTIRDEKPIMMYGGIVGFSLIALSLFLMLAAGIGHQNPDAAWSDYYGRMNWKMK